MRAQSQIDTAVNRQDFPILQQQTRSGNPLVYLDSAATAQLPDVVLKAMWDFVTQKNSAVNRGSHELAEAATIAYENAREIVADFVGVSAAEIVWTKNSTESLNLLAYAFSNASFDTAAARFALTPADNIVVTRAEHHANLVPWQELCKRTGASLRWLDLTPEGRIDLDTAHVIDEHTKVLAFAHVSNVTGAIAPVRQLVDLARKYGALVVLDACQSVPHMPVDFRQLGVDFAVFSAHKLGGPTGVGVLYGKADLLATLPKVAFGGSMVEVVTMESSTYKTAPAGFEAGTQAVAQIVGTAQAVKYLASYGMDKVQAHDERLTAYLLEQLQQVSGVRILGPLTTQDRLGVVAFSVAGVHPHDVGQVLDSYGVAVRVGHHCAQPVHRHFGVASSSRVSIAPYNTKEEIDIFIAALRKVRAFFGLE